jgi:hypothetical protein
MSMMILRAAISPSSSGWHGLAALAKARRPIQRN